VRDNRQLWGREFHRKFQSLIVLQEEIAREIADNLPVALTGREKKRLTKRYTEDPEAQRLYLLGRFAWNKRTKSGLSRAIAYYQEAIEKDPGFALAYAGMADCYNLFAGYGYDHLTPRQAFTRARAMARKALGIDETLAEAHTALAYFKATYAWDWEGAGREFQAALECNPNYSTCHYWHACYLSSMGRPNEALAEIKRARELDPTSLIINGWVAVVLCYGDRTDEALSQAKATVQMDPDFAVSHFFLGVVYQKMRRYEQAIRRYQQAVALDKDSITYLTGLGQAYALSGQAGQARKILAQLAAMAKTRHVSPYGVAAIYAGLGEKDRAIHWLSRAFEERDSGMGNLKIDPNWEGLRSNPRFQDLVRRMKFPAGESKGRR
jgi:tetratricopeptide (TPR) repeat protein